MLCKVRVKLRGFVRRNRRVVVFVAVLVAGVALAFGFAGVVEYIRNGIGIAEIGNFVNEVVGKEDV